MMLTPLTRKHSMRDLLLAFGIGHFNATMIIPIMLTSPSTTDPKQPAVIMLTRAIQQSLIAMGARIPATGYLDHATADVITQLVGNESWINWTWSRLCNAVLAARTANRRLDPIPATPVVASSPVPGATGAFDLPAVPGGALTYAAAGLLAYYFWTKRKR